MKEIIDQLLRNELQLLAGLKLKGRVPVKEELANRIIRDLLEKSRSEEQSRPEEKKTEAGKPASATTPARGDEQAPGELPDPRELLKHLKHLSMEMKEGELLVHFDVEVR